MSFKDFSSAHPERKPTPLSAKTGHLQAVKAVQPQRAPVSKPHAPRQPSAKH